MNESGELSRRRSADATQIVKDCHASVVAARATLERAEMVLKRASGQVEQSERLLRRLRITAPKS